jgi:muramoyltetrapeptide carboxypeptidase
MKAAVKIGVVAPASRVDQDLAEQVTRILRRDYGTRAEITFHPQCFLSSGHFAGDDEARAGAFLAIANDPSYDVMWFARGGYGSGRLIARVLPALNDASRRKIYLGYSDLGALMGAMYASGFERLLHGPMPSDLKRDGGEAAVSRALSFLIDRDPSALEPSVSAASLTAAFNVTILSHLVGMPYEPDLSGHVVMLEEISEHLYRTDRDLLQITACPKIRNAAGIRLGRMRDIPPNDPDFGQSEEEVIEHWCRVSGIAYLGRADIGHDIANKIVPFGRLAAL